MPEGPSILWPLKATKSAPHAVTSVGSCGTCWAASTSTNAFTVLACSTIRDIGRRVPNTFEIAETATTLVLSESCRVKSSKSNSPSSVRPTHFTTAPVRSANCCQGTMFEWCSMMVSRISSPALRDRSPSNRVRATRLIEKVVPPVKITSLEWRAPIKFWTAVRACSYCGLIVHSNSGCRDERWRTFADSNRPWRRSPRGVVATMRRCPGKPVVDSCKSSG